MIKWIKLFFIRRNIKKIRNRIAEMETQIKRLRQRADYKSYDVLKEITSLRNYLTFEKMLLDSYINDEKRIKKL